jgi:acetolactate synthase-1/2/3 large subunit
MTSAEALDGGEALIRAASDVGAEYIFCSSGSEWAPVWEAFARRHEAGTPGPRYLDLAHETTAVGMATGYAAVTGRPQVVLLHAAAGLLQGANAIHGALLAGAPVVICSGESAGYGDAATADPGSQWYRNLSVVGGPQATAAPFTKWACAAADVSVLYGMVKRAGELAAQSPAGPVYINTPVEVLLSPWQPLAADGPAPPPARTVAAEADVEAAARLLAAAQRPVLATETAGRDPEAFAALADLAELLAIPVIEPQSAVCASFPRTHPLHAGGELAPLAADADLVILAGCRSPWYPPSAKPGDATVLVIDETPHRPYMAYQVLAADCYVGGDLALTLRAITARLGDLDVDAGAVRERRERAESAHAAAEVSRTDAERAALASVDGPVDPVAAAAALREILGPGDVVIDETITHSRVIARHLMAETAGRYRYVQGGLGQGLGVALGSKLALGSQLVAFTVGDGSWLYNPVLPGLMASAEHGLPVLVVVFNNGKYLSMRHNHRRAYPDGAAARTGYQLGVDLSAQPDAAAVATAAGAAGFTVRAARELAGALEKAVATVRGGHSAVVNVVLSKLSTERSGLVPTETARSSKVRVSADDLRALVSGIFAARGVREPGADTMAGALVWANLRGIDSHGVSRVPRYLELFDKGESVPGAEPTVKRPRTAIAIVDAHAAPGPVAMNRAVAEAVSGARECGIGWASVRGTVHTGAIGYYTSQAAEAGMAAVGVVAGMPNMAYAGARGAAVATSPLSVAVPAGRHPTVLLDMATAVMALGRIAQLKAAGGELPPGAAVTVAGEPTTDPALAAIPLPVGGPKGSGMSLVFEMLASGLAANPIVPAYHSGDRRHRQNAFILAVDVSAFGDPEAFASAVDDTIEAIKALPPADGAAEILMPGERGHRSERERRASGIPLGPKVWRELTEVAGSLGVSVPDPAS